MWKSDKTRSGFTLIELLSIIAIISVLIAVLTPALGRARAAAKRFRCTDNIRQIHIAMSNYAHDYRDHIITAREMLYTHTEAEVKRLWHIVLTPYVEHIPIKDMLADKYPQLWICPEDRDPYPMGYRGYPHKVGMTSYALNGYYDEGNEKAPSIQFGPAANFKFSQIRNPSQCLLMGETSYCGQIYDARHPNAVRAGLRNDGHHRMTAGFYHNDSMNALFVDGHLETVAGIDCEPDPSMIPWPYKDADYMFWPDKRLPSARENPLFWGPGY
jgi:prepilin-type processing-associated H-X9-DG protein